MKKHNYSAGPSILPQEVFEKSAQAILRFQRNSGFIPTLEISHRRQSFCSRYGRSACLGFRTFRIRRKRISGSYFLHGGASLEFLMVPYNLMNENGKAAYLGYWNLGEWLQ